MHLLVLAAGAFAAMGALALVAPTVFRRARPLVPVLAAAAAVAGVLSAPAATGIEALDALIRASLCAAVVLVAPQSRPWAPALAAAAALAAAGTAGPSAELAAVAFGTALGGAAAKVDTALVNAVVAAVVAQAALRLEGSTEPRVTAYAAAAVFAILLGAGVVGVSRRRRRSILKAASAGIALLGIAGLLGVLAAALARPAVEDGIRAASSGLDAARKGKGPDAARMLNDASRAFAKARRQLDSWWARPAMAVPVVARQSRALRTMAASGAELSRAGARTAEAADTSDLQLVNGAVPLDRLEALRLPTRAAFSSLAVADARLAEVRSPWLVDPLASRLDTLSTKVARGRSAVRSAMRALEIAPGLLGAGGPRRYFLAVQTPSELRGSGGFIGNFGEIGADGGRLTLDKVGRTADLNTGGDPASRKLIAPPDYTARYSRFDVNLLWQNITMSPDFPTVARTIAGLYPQSGGRDVDGVIAIDPIGLAALLKVIGPVEVPGWPVPITADNAASILLFEQYVKLEGDARVDFLGRVTAAVWQRLTTTTSNVGQLADALGPMLAQKHLMLASTHAAEERAFLEMGASGAMAPVRGDFLGVVTQNASGNKIDWFLRRAMDYRAELDPSSGRLRSKLRITLRNEAPSSGLPSYVIGSATEPPLPTGANKLYLSVYSPLFLAGARVDGAQRLMESELERNRHVYSTYVTIPPGGSVVVVLDLEGRIGVPNGYRLTVHRQAFLADDAVTTSLQVPDGWRAGKGEPERRRAQKVELRSDHVTHWLLRRSS
ncbi:MAG TPA: DUF4012 domain-containing protein [Acidimicrobiales bacterium]|nr:DUF4012 domain-containing protein [Acidimicrobiales bacterium]